MNKSNHSAIHMEGRRLNGLFAFLLFCTIAVTPARAQLQVALRTGLNMSDTKLRNLPQTTVGDLFSLNGQDGYFIGPVLHIPLPVTSLGIEVGALYDVRRTEINTKDISLKSIVIPANARFDIKLLSFLGAYLSAGPELSFNIGHTGFTWTDSQQIRNTFRVQSSSFGFNAGAGLRFSNMECGAVYHIPVGRTADLISLSETMNQIYEVRSATTNTWQIVLTWYF